MSLFLEIFMIVAAVVVTLAGFGIALWTALDEAEEGNYWVLIMWGIALTAVIALVITLIVVNISAHEVVS